jgi:hypothetical protein
MHQRGAWRARTGRHCAVPLPTCESHADYLSLAREGAESSRDRAPDALAATSPWSITIPARTVRLELSIGEPAT